MLVVISDLHFVDGTSGRHNLPAAAFTKVLKSALVEAAKNNDAREIKILLLGDIVDLVRSTHWLERPPAHRPWGEEGLADIEAYRDLEAGGVPRPTESACLRILGRLPASGKKEDVAHQDTILYQNWETFAFFRDLSATIHRYKELRRLPVELIYVPGNHDRLCNLYPSVRDELARILGLTISPATVEGNPAGDWWYRYVYLDETYGVLARHGHQFDKANYAGSLQAGQVERRRENLQLPIGEVLTTEFAVRVPWEAAKHVDVLGPGLVRRLQDIDNVRPLGRVLEWLYWEMSGELSQKKVGQKLDEVMDGVVKNLLDIDFVQQWRNPDWHVDEIVRLVSGPVLGPLLGRVLDLTRTDRLLRAILPLIEGGGDEEEDAFVRAAYWEPLWRLNRRLRFVLYGHTHHPKLLPLASDAEREVMYVNTGTWRQRIHRTIGLDEQAGFVNLKHLTHVFLYGPEEDGGGPGGNKRPGTVSYDVWTGQMRKQYR